MKTRSHCLGLALILLVLVVPAIAEQEHHQPSEPAEHAHETVGHHAFQNEIALFLGATDERGHDTEMTLGLEFVHRIKPNWSIGATLEYAAGDLRNTILVVPVYWQPSGGFFLLGGPGIEYHNGRGASDSHNPHKSDPTHIDEDETYFLFRLGAGYSFHIGERYGIIPQVALDFVDGEKVLVYGVNFGVMF